MRENDIWTENFDYFDKFGFENDSTKLSVSRPCVKLWVTQLSLKHNFVISSISKDAIIYSLKGKGNIEN